MDASEKEIEAELEEVGPPGMQQVASITSGSIPRAVWGLAWPTLIANVLMTVTGLINALFVGRLGSGDSIAAIGFAEQILMMVFSIMMSVVVGTTALVARFTGARDTANAEEAARQSLIMGVVASVIATLVLLAISNPVLQEMGARGRVLDLSLAYIRIICIALVPFSFLIVIGAIFRGLGDTRTPMRIMMGVNALAVLFDYGLILGHGPFPRLGVVGAAISSDIVRTAGCIASLYYLLRCPLAGALSGSMRPSWAWFTRILSIGIPSALQALLRTGGSMAFVYVLGRLPNANAAVAALTIGVRTEGISFMPGLAFGAAATSMVGQNLGARRSDRAEKAGWVCVRQAISIMGPMGAVFYLYAGWLARLFTPDPAVIALTASYLTANAVSQPCMAFGMVLGGALQGAGETKVPAWVTFFTMWGIRLPAAYVVALVLGLGASGAWWTMAASSMAYALIIASIYKRGKWKAKEV
jgi:putative MATE family efflux protein